MASRILLKLHSQPKADVLLCVGSADKVHADHKPQDETFVVKRTRLWTSSRTSSDDDEVTRPTLDFTEAQQEVRVIKKLLKLPHHPHIVRYHGVDTRGDSVSITMEHCERGDLLTWLHQQPQQRFPEPQALAIFRQILRAVSFLHNHDIAHRDLSLENCLVAQDHTIKICDFGLATSASTPSRQHVGKLNYMAPEVVRGDYYDPVKADVWSLGIVLFMLLTGSPLFDVAREDSVAYACVQRMGVGGILQQWGMQDDVSESTTELLSAMLSIDQEDRLTTVDDIIDMMGSYLRPL